MSSNKCNLKIYYLSNFQIYNSIINYTHYIVHYIPITYLFDIRSLYLLTQFTHFIPTPTALSGNHQTVLCIYEFCFISDKMFLI